MKQLLLFISIVLICSCSSDKVKSGSRNGAFTIVLSDDEVSILSIDFCRAVPVELDTLITIQGKVIVSSESIHHIHFPMEGFLRKAHKQRNDIISKGDLLATFYHTDFIKIKRDYLHAVNEFNFQKQSYSRQGELAIEQATSIKKMQQSGKEYRRAEIEVDFLESKLKILGIVPSRINSERITDEAYLYSPVNGYLVNTNINAGKYYSHSEAIFQLAKTGDQKVKFIVTDNYVLDYKNGDTLEFQSTWEENKQYKAVFVEVQEDVKSGSRAYLTRVIPPSELSTGPSIYSIVKATKAYLKIPTKAIIDGNFVIIQKGDNIFRSVKVELIKGMGKDVIINKNAALRNGRIVLNSKNQLYKKIKEL